MVEFNQLLQIMSIPFPFPYAQVTAVLIWVYMLFTPFVMILWTNNSMCAGIFTFISIVCIMSINLIATELENPFGDDTNDLPVHEFHEEFVGLLTLLLDPRLHEVPQLKPTMIWDPNQLRANMKHNRCQSMIAYQAKHGTGPVQTPRISLDYGVSSRAPSGPSEDKLDVEASASQPLHDFPPVALASKDPGRDFMDSTAEELSGPGWPEQFLRSQQSANKEFLAALNQMLQALEGGAAQGSQAAALREGRARAVPGCFSLGAS